MHLFEMSTHVILHVNRPHINIKPNGLHIQLHIMLYSSTNMFEMLQISEIFKYKHSENFILFSSFISKIVDD